MRLKNLLPLALAFVGLAGPASTQSNTVPGLDIQLAFMDDISARGRLGTFPTGVNGVALETTICNRGTVEVPWFQAMNPAHPTIAFIIARESNGRFEQISNRSYVKHAFFALTSSQCTTCQPPGGPAGTKLGIGCSDTYSIFNNGDNFWLGPPEEIDPWLGIWDPVCSYFDMGNPAVPPPQDCDGIRSFTQSQSNALGVVGNRINVLDADLNVAGANFYMQGYYTTQGEAEPLREDNMATRPISAVWTGAKWNLNETGTLINGSILQQWSGSSLDSNTNGTDDGRVYVAVAVTGPVDGLYHYEYAVQNRDNFQGVGGFRLPVCDSAQVLNLDFRDIDQDAANQWDVTVANGEIAFTTQNNPIHWNTFFNFSFDSDAAPIAGTATIDEFDLIVGQPSFGVPTSTPGALYNVYLGEGCALGAAPTLFSNDRATIGNASFSVETAGNVAGQPNALLFSQLDGLLPLGICNVYLGGTLGVDIYFAASAVADGSGRVNYGVPVPNDVSLEGATVNVQTVGFNPAGGAIFNTVELSNGLQVRIGDSIVDCP